MSWDDPKGVWATRMRWRVVIHAVTLALGVPMAFVPSALLLLFVDEGVLDRRLAAFAIATPLAVAAAIAVPSGLALRREREVRRRVPAHDGVICVRCRTPLPEDARATPEVIVACVGCGREQSPAAARRAWADYVVSGAARTGRAPLAGDAGDGDGLVGSLRRLFRRRPWITGLSGFILLAGIHVVFALVAGESVAVRLHDGVPMILAFGSIWLLTGGLAGRREGAERTCTKCRYPQPAEGAGPACPECGADWLAPGGTMQGRMRPRLGPLVAGVLAFMFGMGLMITGGMRPALMPTGLLVAGLATGTGWEFRMWPELGGRTLTPRQRDRLTAGLVSRVEADDHVSVEGHQWLLERLAAGELTAEQRASYLGDAMRLRTVRVETARVGEPLRLLLDVQAPEQLATGTAATWGLLVEAVELGSGDRTDGWDAILGEFRLAEEHAPSHGRRGDRFEVVAAGPPPAAAGPVTVRVHVRRAILPFGTPSLPIRRDATGAPVLPPAVRWSERSTVEHAITVEPATE